MNRVELEGVVVQDPRRRELPSGTVIWNVEVQTHDSAGDLTTVPVALVEGLYPHSGLRAGDRVWLLGCLRRRFFRVGGVTQSRVEVVPDEFRKVKP